MLGRTWGVVRIHKKYVQFFFGDLWRGGWRGGNDPGKPQSVGTKHHLLTVRHHGANGARMQLPHRHSNTKWWPDAKAPAQYHQLQVQGVKPEQHLCTYGHWAIWLWTLVIESEISSWAKTTTVRNNLNQNSRKKSFKSTHIYHLSHIISYHIMKKNLQITKTYQFRNK